MKEKEPKHKTPRLYDIEEPFDHGVMKPDPVEYNGKKIIYNMDIIEDRPAPKSSKDALKQLITYLAIAKKKTPLEVLREMR
ncbi:MAG: hypothetical protein ACQERS_11265 [Bacteroidota bacterium]